MKKERGSQNLVLGSGRLLSNKVLSVEDQRQAKHSFEKQSFFKQKKNSSFFKKLLSKNMIGFANIKKRSFC